MNTNYSYINAPGHPGMIADQSPRRIVARLLDADVLGFGCGVVHGATPGKTVAIPTSTSVEADFEGVLVNHGTVEHAHITGGVAVKEGTTCSVMRYGTIWVRVETDIEPAYGDALKLLVAGDEAGCFTTADTEGTAVNVAGIFLGEASNGIAKVELFNTVAVADADTSGGSGGTT